MLSDISAYSISEVFPPNAMQVFAEVLSTTHDVKLRAHIIFIIGNVAVESPSLRDNVLESIVPTVLVRVLNSSCDIDVLHNGVFALTALSMGSNPPGPEKTEIFIPAFAQLINTLHTEVIANSCYVLRFLCETSPSNIQRVVEAEVCPRLVELLNFQNQNVVTAVIRLLGKISCGNDQQTQTVIDSKALPVLRRLLKSEHEEIVLDACWVISNIAAGNGHQIQAVVNANIFPEILNLLESDNCKIQTEAAWVMKQAMSKRRSSFEQIDYFIYFGFVDALLSLLKSTCCHILTLALHALDTMLLYGTEFQIEEVHGEFINIT